MRLIPTDPLATSANLRLTPTGVLNRRVWRRPLLKECIMGNGALPNAPTGAPLLLLFSLVIALAPYGQSSDWGNRLGAINTRQVVLNRYALTGADARTGISIRHYELASMDGATDDGISKRESHSIDIYVPAHAQDETALLWPNDDDLAGTPGCVDHTRPPDDVRGTAQRSHTIVVVVGEPPRHYLTMVEGTDRRTTRDLVNVGGWRYSRTGNIRYLSALPMAVALSQAMTLTEGEMHNRHIHHFILADTRHLSEAAELVAKADTRVVAISPSPRGGVQAPACHGWAPLTTAGTPHDPPSTRSQTHLRMITLGVPSYQWMKHGLTNLATPDRLTGNTPHRRLPAF